MTTLKNVWRNFEADIDFGEESSVLHVVVPNEAFKHLLAGGSSRHFKINRNDVLSILAILIQNPGNSAEKRSDAKTLLGAVLDNPKVNSQERALINDLLALEFDSEPLTAQSQEPQE
jgi:hypothetical protein